MENSKKMVTCPHCRGYTKCSCADCGTTKTVKTGFNFPPETIVYIKGRCKTCNGLGKVPQERVK